MTKHHRLPTGLALAVALMAGLATSPALAQDHSDTPADPTPETPTGPGGPSATDATPQNGERPAPAPDPLLDDIVRVMCGEFASEDLSIISTPMHANDADRVIFTAAETGEGQTMGQVFFQVFRYKGEPRVRMIRLPGGVAAAPGLYAAMDAIGPISLSQLDITGDLIPTYDEATDTLSLRTDGMAPTCAGDAVMMHSEFSFSPQGMTIAEKGFDTDGNDVWSFPEGGKGDLKREGAAPVAKKTDSGLRIQIIKEGGDSAPVGASGDTYTVNYTGWLPSGQLFDTSKQPGREPFTIAIPGGVIQGWNEGLIGMRVGEVRRLFIPPSLGYGERGAGGVIPPNSWLVFDVELLDVKKTIATPAPASTPAPTDDMSHEGHDHDGH